MSKQARRRRGTGATPGGADDRHGDEPWEPMDDAGARRPGDAALDEAGGHTVKHQRPGVGREEQIHPYPPPRDHRREDAAGS